LSITVLQGNVAMRVNYGRMFNDFLIANLLLSVMVKEFWRSVGIWQSYKVAPFFPDTVYLGICTRCLYYVIVFHFTISMYLLILRYIVFVCLLMSCFAFARHK